MAPQDGSGPREPGEAIPPDAADKAAEDRIALAASALLDLVLEAADLAEPARVAERCAQIIERTMGWPARVVAAAAREGEGRPRAEPNAVQLEGNGRARVVVAVQDGPGSELVLEARTNGTAALPALERVGRLCATACGVAARARRGRDEVRRAESDGAELLEANRRLRELDQRKDDFLSICAHELRSPASAILEEAEILLHGIQGPLGESQRKGIELVERHAQRVLEVARGLVDLRALELGRVELRRQPIELGRLCAEVADAFAPAAREKGASLTRNLPPYPLTLQIDASKVREVLATILSNAVLLTAPGGNVTVALEAIPSGVRIAIEDSRPGALAQELPLLLQRYPGEQPGAPRASAVAAGWGLGLAICRELVELHGGTLEAASVAGRGTRYVITLPSPGPGAAEQRRPSGALGKPRVLLVDDDDDTREALSALLEPDYLVAQAKDGQEAVEAARADPPDLVLMDLVMPRLDGLAALERLRGDPRTAEVPVILVSARADDVTKVRSLDSGAVDFLQKPFSERELKARIERTLRLTRRWSQLWELAQTDALTGLANLRAFRARLDDEVKRARRYRTSLACVMADMDHLKPVNDELGHAAGDRAIAAVAEVIRAELRETDFGARYGGDEFVILLPHTTAAEAKTFAQRVCARLRETLVHVSGRRIPLVASFGVSALSEAAGDEAGESLVHEADAALYAAKRTGRGRVALFGEITDQAAPPRAADPERSRES